MSRFFVYIRDVNNVLQILAKHDKELRKMVSTFGLCDYPEDIVQEFYLKVYKNKLTNTIDNDKPNFAYCWMVLRNLYYDTHKKKTTNVNIDELIHIGVNDNLFAEDEREIMQEKLNKEINSWEWFDKELFLIYLHGGKSMRKIAEDSNISLTSIFHTIKKCKQKLKLWQRNNQEVLEIL